MTDIARLWHKEIFFWLYLPLFTFIWLDLPLLGWSRLQRKVAGSQGRKDGAHVDRHVLGVLTRYTVTTRVNIVDFCVFARYKTRYDA
ncbi:MAG: hypothetical protein ABSA47_02255 [Verrucomicrobiota bacterium]|jgi:hypothetical protein